MLKLDLEAALFLQKLLRVNGIESKIIELESGRSNLVVEIKQVHPVKVLVISGHMDVAQAGNHDLWQHDPYETDSS